MRIIVDVMGGDHAPLETVRGACAAAAEYNANFILVGDRPRIEQIAAEEGLNLKRFEIVHTDVEITMEDDPLSVVRAKSESSMSTALRLLAEGRGDAMVSAGNTGALFTGATLIVRKIKGIQRAALATVLPMVSPVLLLDCGANISVTEEYLEQFAVMGSVYMNKIYGLEKPRVGLLNNGTEPTKGTELQRAAYERLSRCPRIRFVGNVEGSGLVQDACDVLVTDGFTGNVMLKAVEGMGKLMVNAVKDVFFANKITMVSGLMVKKQLSAMKKNFDATEHGGAPLLGISKPVIKAHGSSNANAFKNAIRQAIACCNNGITYDIAEAAAEFAAQKKREKEALAAREEEAQSTNENSKEEVK